ncbi:hypothetical protein, partial [Caballeronia sp. INDeC2]|uniref:hypothetical protein n=1 Tax=Caballeronia sp. INDeC2 TaxID=2921747 RepID=UPI002027AFB1
MTLELSALGESIPPPEPAGTLARYAQYPALRDLAFARHMRTGWRSQTALTPALVPYEGQRV